MNMSYHESVKNEINRVRSLGWVDTSTLDQGINLLEPHSAELISFPEETYSPLDGNSEASNLWSQYRTQIVLDLLTDSNISIIWEVGAGDGNMAIPLRDFGVFTVAIEPLTSGAKVLAKEDFVVYLSRLESLNLPDNSLGAIGLFDVLEHLENPEDLLFEIRRILQPDGILLTSVPAHGWLFSDFDIVNGHFRRYSRKTLSHLLKKSGFTENRIQYRFFFLVLPALFLRKIPYLLGKRRDFIEVRTTSQSQNRFLNSFKGLLGLVLRFESRVNPPFGLSLFSKSSKKSC